MKITAPAAASMSGEFRTVYGPTELRFVDGVADVDEIPDGLRDYLLRTGYTVDGEHVPPPAEPEPVDSRDFTGEHVGTPLRDAAVDPHPEDFLPPVNAGEADPHGPLVVAPGIHAEGERAVRPGVVASDPDQQTRDEQQTAEILLIENRPADDAVDAAVPDRKEFGPLGLSDPGSVQAGLDGAQAAADETQGAPGDEPKGNASRDAWVSYARTQGAPDDELGEDGLSRDELRAKYGS